MLPPRSYSPYYFQLLSHYLKLNHLFRPRGMQWHTCHPHLAAQGLPVAVGPSDVIEFANILRNQRPPLSTAEQLVNEWLAQPERQRPDPDPRIVRAVELITQHHDQNVSVEWIGRQVGLSVPRLSQLFKEVVGTPIRRFRLWHRVFVTAAKLRGGAGLTDAALAAGFADYAQFARTYRQLAGGNASQARDNTEIVVRGYA